MTFKLVIQSSQCGSIIGKGGSKIKDIREVKIMSLKRFTYFHVKILNFALIKIVVTYLESVLLAAISHFTAYRSQAPTSVLIWEN